MIISVASSPSPPPLLSTTLLRPCITSQFSNLRVFDWKTKKKKVENQGARRGTPGFRAELSQDAPFAVAIGACVLNSLVFPLSYGDGPDDDDDSGGGSIDSTDARFAVMGIISFIPYFNWMSWVFAWLDSGKRRYLVYSIVYLAPYLRTNLSLSPEESWLPIASIFFCLIHIQLEASIRSGDLNTAELFDEALKLLFPMIKKKATQFQSNQRTPKKERNQENLELPSEQESRDKLREWGIPRKPVDDPRHLKENPDVNAKKKNSD